jgi:hypothetical protein
MGTNRLSQLEMSSSFVIAVSPSWLCQSTIIAMSPLIHIAAFFSSSTILPSLPPSLPSSSGSFPPGLGPNCCIYIRSILGKALLVPSVLSLGLYLTSLSTMVCIEDDFDLDLELGHLSKPVLSNGILGRSWDPCE